MNASTALVRLPKGDLARPGLVSLRRRMIERALDEGAVRQRVWLEALEPRRMMSVVADGAVPADLDATFGTGGVATFSVPAARGSNAADLPTIVTAPDGKILVYGGYQQRLGQDDYVDAANFWVARFNADGSPDQSFGVGGVARVAAPASSQIYSVVPEADGKLLVLTDHTDLTASDVGGLTFMRFNGDGSLDTTFGSGGSFVIAGASDPASPRVDAAAMWVAGDGRILALFEEDDQLRMVRLSADGAADDSFGAGGVRVVGAFDPDGAWSRSVAVEALPGGGAVADYLATVDAVAGVSPPRDTLSMLRVDDAGDVVSSATFVRTPEVSVSVEVVPEPDGSALLFGGDLERVRADGTLDAAFGGGEGSDFVENVLPTILPQADGSTLLLETIFGPDGATSGVQRLTAEGVPDGTFAGGLAAGGFAANATGDARNLPDGSVLLTLYHDDNDLAFSLVKIRPDGGAAAVTAPVDSGAPNPAQQAPASAAPAAFGRVGSGQETPSGINGLFAAGDGQTVWDPDGVQAVYA